MLRSRALLAIASGYLFTALILLPWILAFPGIFAAKGLIGELQSTSALYLSWHVGFAIFVIAYGVEGQQIRDAAVARRGRSGDRNVRRPRSPAAADRDDRERRCGHQFSGPNDARYRQGPQALKRIVSGGHRAAGVLASIRAIYKQELQNRVELDVNLLIVETLALLNGDQQKHRILQRLDPGQALPAVKADLVQIRQLLLNLLTNAIDAMASKEGPRMLGVKSEACAGDGLMVSVADTGEGVVPRDIDRIFNPLCTTKLEGMGMGLSICRTIVEGHGGRLWVSPNTPQGAVFQFTLHVDGLAAPGG